MAMFTDFSRYKQIPKFGLDPRLFYFNLKPRENKYDDRNMMATEYTM